LAPMFVHVEAAAAPARGCGAGGGGGGGGGGPRKTVGGDDEADQAKVPAAWWSVVL